MTSSVIGLRADGSPIRSWGTDVHVDDPRPHVLVVGENEFEVPGWIVTRVEAPSRTLTFPPAGEAYKGPNAEAHVLWRWALVLGPDAVIGNDALSEALVSSGKVRRWKLEETAPSPLRLELRERLARSSRTVAEQLSANYGHQFAQVHYIPALALVGGLRLARRTGDEAAVDGIRKLALAAPEPPSLPGPVVAGFLVHAEFAQEEPEARARLLRAAEVAFDVAGRPLPFVPIHEEMSDSVFMVCPLLAAAGELTGESRYFDACLNHLRFMRRMCVRPDGLYRHSPLNDAAWGRGNGFPALGLALTLAHWPSSAPGREEIVSALREHLTALAKHQGADGTWRQVIDEPGSYREFSATCMIAFAFSRAVDGGWLDAAEFRPRVERAWDAVKLRIDLKGVELTDVCAGTGKQPSFEDYLRRTAILGRDDRGGAFALLLATELDR